MKQHTITSYAVRLHCLHMTSNYFQRPLEEARQISARNDKDASLAGLRNWNEMISWDLFLQFYERKGN